MQSERNIHTYILFFKTSELMFHISFRGNERLFASIKNMIVIRHPDLSPDNLPIHMPEWSQLEDGLNSTCK